MKWVLLHLHVTAVLLLPSGHPVRTFLRSPLVTTHHRSLVHTPPALREAHAVAVRCVCELQKLTEQRVKASRGSSLRLFDSWIGLFASASQHEPNRHRITPSEMPIYEDHQEFFLGLNSWGPAEFNKAGCSPRHVSSAVLGSVRSTHMQIAALKSEEQGAVAALLSQRWEVV
ncbi:hypothetical protein NQZ68_006259 [Dissostichus eleginoides]|nr:hypothetical protein NQZ68_006259 [Dissostichus eleginoides]